MRPSSTAFGPLFPQLDVRLPWLPTDASLSRLAMYVNGKLMEGGMAERDHARNTFEEIKRKMLAPALLEWVDGSTFKMRVFPLEARQEKRIILSYSQRLPSADGQRSYRFPAGHTMDAVRDWSAHVVVKGGAGSPLLARAQIEIIRTLLENAEHADTFSIVQASTRAAVYADEPELCTAENIAAAVKYLETVHLVGALDLEAALKKCGEVAKGGWPWLESDSSKPRGFLRSAQSSPGHPAIIIHVGSGMPALGERDAAKLAELIPADAQYIGIGVGRRWNESMMKQAASRTGGLWTQINPDEEIAWRAFEVFSKQHSPRLVDVKVTTDSDKKSGNVSIAPSPPGKGEKVAGSPDEGTDLESI